MLFPANFWPHKNHRMLLTAYGMFIARNPGEKLDLVLAGVLENEEKKLKDDAEKMGLEKRVHFIGLERQHRLAAVWQGCSFLIFPSLYETFCGPLLEALLMGKPIVCSDIPALSEIAQDAALYFDPRKPESIVGSLERIMRESSLGSDLIQRGQQRIKDFKINEPRENFRDRFYFLSGADSKYQNSITGIFEDIWTESEIIVAFKAGPKNRSIGFHFEAPSLLPYRTLKLYVTIKDGPIREHSLQRGDDIVISHILPKASGYLKVWVSHVFRPSDIIYGSLDHRFLGCLCHGCWMVYPPQERITVFGKEDNLNENRI